MTVTVGGVSINIGANTDGLTTGINNAKTTVRSGVDSIQGAAESMKGYLAAIGVGLSIGAFAGWIKGAIDAADETSKMAQKIGVATEEVAGLQLAFRQAGAGEVFEQSMAKLSKSAADGSDAFAAMGINVKNNDGTLKSTRALLGEVADGMAGYADGAAKSALAQELFGKSGAQLIPLLNAGSKALDDYDATAKKLGLTLSEETAKEAEKFNDTMDLIGQGTQGVARQIGAQLLPTLSGLADQFLTSMTSGDKLANTAQFLGSVMKVLYVAGVGIVEVFSTVGKTLGGVSAAVVAALTGDFTGAANILKEMKADIGTGWKDSLKQIQGAWNATGSAAVDAMVSTQKALKGAAPLVKDLDAQTKALAKTQKEQAEEQKKAEAEFMKIMQARAALRLKESDSIDAYMLAEEKARSATINASNEALAAARAEYANYGKTRSQLAEVTLARLEDKLQAYHAGTDNANAVLLEIENQKELIAILQKGEVREASKKSADDAEKAWAETSKSIESALTDSLMRGFESGKSMVDSARDYISNAFKSIVVKMAVQPVMGAIGGLFGMGGANAATGGAGGGIMETIGGLFGGGGGGESSLGGLGNIASSVMGGLGAFGTGASYGLQSLFANGLGGTLSAGSSMVGAGSTMAGIGTIAGAIAPIALGIAALSKAMAYTITPTGNALTATVGSGGIVNGTAGTRADFRQEGGFLGGGNTDNATWGIADAGTTSYIDAAVQSVSAANAAYANVLGLSASAMNGFTQNLDINVTGMDAAAAKAAINAAAMAFGNDQVAASYGSVIAQFANVGESASQTLQRLAELSVGMDTLNSFGGIFSQIALGGISATDAMASLAGGLDKLIAKSQAFVSSYYNENEQTGIAARGVLAALSASGISAEMIAGLSNKSDFRALVESIDVTTATGQSQLNALLDIAPQFANLSGALEQQGGSLQGLAELAPQIAALQPVFSQGAADQQAATAAAADNTQAAISSVTSAVTAGTNAVVAAIAGLAGGISSMAESSAASAEALQGRSTQPLLVTIA